ncbi:MAG: hypothetical protein NC041_03360 [Bacteroides sp.]|nr:hypothetical protein [Prevotella sp.]MCM1408162.1 hypothetical protein [Treponema brennaborense]MCM1469486.1 hypothetical protein [Bacteroides sp.]
MADVLSRLERELVLRFIAEEHPVFHVFSAEKNNAHSVSVDSYSLEKETIAVKKGGTSNAVFLSAAGTIKFFFYYKGRGLFFYTDFRSDNDAYFCPVPVRIEKQRESPAAANEMQPLCIMRCGNGGAETELRCFASDGFPPFGAEYASFICGMNEAQVSAACGIFEYLADDGGIKKEAAAAFVRKVQTLRAEKADCAAAEQELAENTCGTDLLPLFSAAAFFSAENEFRETALQDRAAPVAVLHLSDTAVVFGRKSRFAEIRRNNEYPLKMLLPSLIGVRIITAAARAEHVFEYASESGAVMSAAVCRFSALAEEDRRFLSENVRRPSSVLRHGASV